MSNDSQSNWNSFVLSRGGSFLQSWEWGELQEKLDVPFWRLSVDGEHLLVIKRPLPMGRCWLYVPRHPLVASAQSAEVLYEKLLELGREQRALFIRIEPHSISSGDASGGLRAKGKRWRKALVDVQPRHTRVIDLTHSEEELLADMHKKTRYNIRLAQRKGVTVRFSRDPKDLEAFLKLADEVSTRGLFHFHPPAYYQAMLAVLGRAKMFEFGIVEHGTSVLAVHLLITFGDTVTYVHGASSSSQRELMAPHLLQWESLLRAKKAGASVYDLWGTAGPGAGDDHPWAGITRFKEGFGGHSISYPGAYDLSLDTFGYGLYKVIRAFRKSH